VPSAGSAPRPYEDDGADAQFGGIDRLPCPGPFAGEACCPRRGDAEQSSYGIGGAPGRRRIQDIRHGEDDDVAVQYIKHLRPGTRDLP